MFQWLFDRWRDFTGLFVFRGERPDLFSPRQRAIYHYYSGTDARGRQVYTTVDPMELVKRIAAVRNEIAINFKVAMSKSKDADECFGKLIDLLRGVFAVKDLAQNGLTEVEVLQLYHHFNAYMESLKKSTSSTATPAPATSPASPPSPDGSPDTSSSSASGSTESVNNSEPPEPTPTAAPSPPAP